MPGATVAAGTDLEAVLPGIYRTAEHVLIDLSGEARPAEAALWTIARGCLAGIPAIVVGADEATRDQIRDMVSPPGMAPRA